MRASTQPGPGNKPARPEDTSRHEAGLQLRGLAHALQAIRAIERHRERERKCCNCLCIMDHSTAAFGAGKISWSRRCRLWWPMRFSACNREEYSGRTQATHPPPSLGAYDVCSKIQQGLFNNTACHQILSWTRVLNHVLVPACQQLVLQVSGWTRVVL